MQITKPNKIISSLRLMPGDKVADFGCGHGHYIREIEGKVGPLGTIYAVDIQKPLLDSIVNKNKENGYSNIVSIWQDLEESAQTNIEAASVNAVIIANVLFMLTGTGSILREAYRILKPGGSLLVVDFHTGITAHAPPQKNIRSEAEISIALKLAGFSDQTTLPAGRLQYAMISLKQK